MAALLQLHSPFAVGFWFLREGAIIRPLIVTINYLPQGYNDPITQPCTRKLVIKSKEYTPSMHPVLEQNLANVKLNIFHGKL